MTRAELQRQIEAAKDQTPGTAWFIYLTAAWVAATLGVAWWGSL